MREEGLPFTLCSQAKKRPIPWHSFSIAVVEAAVELAAWSVLFQEP